MILSTIHQAKGLEWPVVMIPWLADGRFLTELTEAVTYHLPEQNGLRESWDYPTIYVNPPYGSDKERRTTIKDWLYRCAHAHKHYGAEVLALIPVATNTSHWKQYVWGRATGVCFLYDTRLRFLVEGKDEGKGAPMACAMIYWDKNVEKFLKVFNTRDYPF